MARFAVAAVLLACAGCVLIEGFGGGERALVFSHRVHVVEEELSCLNCHEDAEASAAPGMPPASTCEVCHDYMDEEQPPERRVATLFDEGGAFVAKRFTSLAGEVRFDHLAHASALGDCGACHEDVASSGAAAPEHALDMDACMDCHAKRAIGNECATCHAAIDRDWAPPGHALGWERRHGDVCRRGLDDAVNRCSLCHEDSTCEQCHREVAPRSHDAHWRSRGHGISARMDRGRCATCHESFSCDSCHAEVRPLDHGGVWGGTLSRHCVSCHLPVQSSRCSACHADTPSHDLGPAKPDWHEASFDCRQCHGAAQLPLSHADNGSNCNVCHP